jgi:hypothetical protein
LHTIARAAGLDNHQKNKTAHGTIGIASHCGGSFPTVTHITDSSMIMESAYTPPIVKHRPIQLGVIDTRKPDDILLSNLALRLARQLSSAPRSSRTRGRHTDRI